jgi:hypothetical protein
VGFAPHVGAALVVGKNRIQNQVSGECANPLELLYRWLDELELRGVDPALIDDIARDFAHRRGFDLARPSRAAGVLGVVDATGRCAREIGEALASALERARTPDQKLKECTDAMEALQSLAAAIRDERGQATTA